MHDEMYEKTKRLAVTSESRGSTDYGTITVPVTLRVASGFAHNSCVQLIRPAARSKILYGR